MTDRAEREDALIDRAYGLGILHGLKLADAGAWEDARTAAERLIEAGRKVLLGRGEERKQ